MLLSSFQRKMRKQARRRDSSRRSPRHRGPQPGLPRRPPPGPACPPAVPLGSPSSLPARPQLTSLLGVAPACDPDGLAGREDIQSIRQADGPHGAAVRGRLLQLQQSDVIVEGEVIEGRVDDDALELVLLHPAGAALALVMQAQEGGPHGGVRVPGQGGAGAAWMSARPQEPWDARPVTLSPLYLLVFLFQYILI